MSYKLSITQRFLDGQCFYRCPNEHFESMVNRLIDYRTLSLISSENSNPNAAHVLLGRYLHPRVSLKLSLHVTHKHPPSIQTSSDPLNQHSPPSRPFPGMHLPANEFLKRHTLRIAFLPGNRRIQNGQGTQLLMHHFRLFVWNMVKSTSSSLSSFACVKFQRFVPHIKVSDAGVRRTDNKQASQALDEGNVTKFKRKRKGNSARWCCMSCGD